MSSLKFSVVGAAILLQTAAAAMAQEPVPQPAPDPEFFAVIGLADNDLLNLRATASASGMLIARVPGGSVVRNHGCAEVNKITWCKVANADDAKEMGWAAQRYLQPIDAQGSAEFSTDDAQPEPESDIYIDPIQ